MLHEDFPDVGGGILLEGLQDFVDLVFPLQQLGPDLLGALAPQPYLTLEEVDVEGEETVPILARLIEVDTHLRILLQDAEKLAFVTI